MTYVNTSLSIYRRRRIGNKLQEGLPRHVDRRQSNMGNYKQVDLLPLKCNSGNFTSNLFRVPHSEIRRAAIPNASMYRDGQ